MAPWNGPNENGLNVQKVWYAACRQPVQVQRDRRESCVGKGCWSDERRLSSADVLQRLHHVVSRSSCVLDVSAPQTQRHRRRRHRSVHSSLCLSVCPSVCHGALCSNSIGFICCGFVSCTTNKSTTNRTNGVWVFQGRG